MKQKADSLEQALRSKAMDWLAQREYGRHELKRKLWRRFFATRGSSSEEHLSQPDKTEINETLLDKVLDWLEERQFLDDDRCSRLLVRSHIEKGHGPLRIRQELVYRKALSETLVDTHLEGSECDWFDLAKSVLQRRFKRPAGNLKEKARQLRFLQRRGFTSEQCYYALSVLEEA